MRYRIKIQIYKITLVAELRRKCHCTRHSECGCVPYVWKYEGTKCIL